MRIERVRGAGMGGGAWMGVLGLGVALSAAPAAGQRLGPVDGFELPPTEIERVVVGASAPDFRLATLGGDTLALSDFRGKKDVILVFYRGWW